jgi:HAD superfamily hydrolase (TIGR01509 family)
MAELVIFDCDGVLIDSEPIANRIFAEQLARAGLAMPLDEVMRTFVGRTRDGCIELAGRMLGHELPKDFGTRWDEALFDALGREVRPVAGIEEVLDGLALPWCVASNGEPDRMRLALRAAGLLERVGERLFSARQVARPKPAPDLFLHAASAMGASPEACLVVEDTPTGVKAAVAAGMKAFGYAGAAHTDAAQLRQAGATTFTAMAQLPRLLREAAPPPR